MTRTTFCSVLLLWLVAAGHCKKYLMELADDKGDQGDQASQDTDTALPDLDQVDDESQQPFLEERTESKGKHSI